MNIASKQWIQIFKIPNNNFSIFGKTFTYKSAYSLDKLYPTHSIKLFTPTFVSLFVIYQYIWNVFTLQ